MQTKENMHNFLDLKVIILKKGSRNMVEMFVVEGAASASTVVIEVNACA